MRASRHTHVSRTLAGTCYVLLVTVWLLALLPTSLLEIAAGFIFGFWTATVCSTCGKVLGSFISFAIGRHYKDLVRERLLQPAPGEGSRRRHDWLGTYSYIYGTFPVSDVPTIEECSEEPQDTCDWFQLLIVTRLDTRLDHPRSGTGPGYAAGLQLAMRARPFATCAAASQLTVSIQNST